MCAHTQEGTSPSCLIAHNRDAHPVEFAAKKAASKAARAARRAGGAEFEPADETEAAKPSSDEAEDWLLAEILPTFVAADLALDAYSRVISYLSRRFGDGDRDVELERALELRRHGIDPTAFLGSTVVVNKSEASV